MLADYGKLHVSSADYTVLRPDGVAAATQGWRSALAEGRALRVRGSGHGLSGATLPRTGETLLCTRGLDHYRVEAPGLIAVGGGATPWDVRDFAAGRGWRLPVYNGGWAGPSVGVVAPRGCARALGKNRRTMPSAWLAQCPRTAPLLGPDQSPYYRAQNDEAQCPRTTPLLGPGP